MADWRRARGFYNEHRRATRDCEEESTFRRDLPSMCSPPPALLHWHRMTDVTHSLFPYRPSRELRHRMTYMNSEGWNSSVQIMKIGVHQRPSNGGRIPGVPTAAWLWNANKRDLDQLLFNVKCGSLDPLVLLMSGPATLFRSTSGSYQNTASPCD